MTYRRTRKAAAARAERLAAMRAAKEAKRLNSEPPAYPAPLPEVRMRITVERLDFGRDVHVFELHKTNRVDVYAITVDGQPWKRGGLTAALEGLRKACPRVASERALY
jgi:hypothetical protein